MSLTSQTLSSLVAIPPFEPAGGMGSVAVTAFLATSIRIRAGFFPQTGAQMLANPEARPEHASGFRWRREPSRTTVIFWA